MDNLPRDEFENEDGELRENNGNIPSKRINGRKRKKMKGGKETIQSLLSKAMNMSNASDATIHNLTEENGKLKLIVADLEKLIEDSQKKSEIELEKRKEEISNLERKLLKKEEEHNDERVIWQAERNKMKEELGVMEAIKNMLNKK